MAPNVERLSLDISLLGEGPHWDVERQTLYYVDIFGTAMYRYTPSTKKFAKVSTAPKRPTFIVPVSGKKNQFVVALDRDVVILSWDGESDKYSIVEVICSVNGPETLIFNDGKCDSKGRLWAGTLKLNPADKTKTLPEGILYSINANRELKEHLKEVLLTNGLAFNDKLKKFYYIDSGKETVFRFDYDSTKGAITNREDFFTLKKNNIPGLADGMTIDIDGNLWVALFNGSRIIKIDGSKPQTLLQTINLPAQQPTSVIWGGPNLDELYVTTASWEQNGKKPQPPENGDVYKITNTGTKGVPGHNFILN